MNSPRLPSTGIAIPKDGLKTVRDLMTDSLRASSLAPLLDEIGGAVNGGKMLRARLSLTVGAASGAPRETLLRAAAAVEMMHAASLLHDDVIDGGHLRRGAPSFWTKKGISGAILLGDLMVCKALQLLDGTQNGRLSALLVRVASEMCDAEVDQELVTRGTDQDWEKSVAMARKKTGSLFAFAAAATDGADATLGDALLEAGYRIGTAYQLADDLLDACGESVRDGKALGTDASRGKVTSVSAAGGSAQPARRCIQELCATSLELLAPWPAVQSAWNEYLQSDFGPVVKLFAGEQSHPA